MLRTRIELHNIQISAVSNIVSCYMKTKETDSIEALVQIFDSKVRSIESHLHDEIGRYSDKM
jgi:hypothetical protein